MQATPTTVAATTLAHTLTLIPTSTCAATLLGELETESHSNRFGLVYLCPVFWQAPLTGTDSQGGTLIHEVIFSTFTTVNGED